MFKSISAEKKVYQRYIPLFTTITSYMCHCTMVQDLCACVSQSVYRCFLRQISQQKKKNLTQKPGKSLDLHLNPFVCNTTCNTHTRASVLWAMCLWISVGIWLLFPFSMSQAQRLSAWVTALRPPRQPDWPLKTQYIISENVTTVLSNYSNTDPDPDRAFKIDSVRSKLNN